MAFTLMTLPYAKDALAPHVSPETIDFHYGKHHQAYVTNLNNLVAADAALAGKSLEDIVRSSSGGLFNNAAQVWNHDFYWNSLSPSSSGAPHGKLAAAIDASFGSFAAFKEKFGAACLGRFGSGWAWLVRKPDGKVEIVTTANAETPFTTGDKALLTCDVWEHAYYIDYRNARAKYVEGWWALANWEFAEANYAG